MLFEKQDDDTAKVYKTKVQRITGENSGFDSHVDGAVAANKGHTEDELKWYRKPKVTTVAF